MFVMMNAARLQVAMQGVGHAQSAWQAASAYARERVQGRAAPIAQHAAIRRILLDAQAIVEGERAIGYWIAHWLDVAAHDPQPPARLAASRLASLLTPVAKAFFTANGFAAASNALQVFGGYGYVHEYGIEQTVRDCRVSMLYEGTNEIQAIDLLVRKVLGDRGEALHALLELIRTEAAQGVQAAADERVRDAGARVATLCAELERVTAGVIRASEHDPDLPYRVADDYLALVGWLLLAFAWARTLRIVGDSPGDDSFRAGKRAVGTYFFDYPLAAFAHRLALVDAGCRAALPVAAA